MHRDRLGLSETLPDRREIRFALAIVGAVWVASLATLPVRDVKLAAVNSFVPTINAVLFAADLIVAALLYAQAAVLRSRALTVLASGYMVTALLVVPQTLTFPGAFAPNGLFAAGTDATAWLATFRLLALPAAVILYAWLRRADSTAQQEGTRPSAGIGAGILVAIGVATLATLSTTSGQHLLPAFFRNNTEVIPSTLISTTFAIIALTLVAMVLLFRADRSLLDIWLLVALSCLLARSILNLPMHARFTLGWYSLWGLMLVSSLTVTIALIAETNRLHMRLALSIAARDRERETRLMSMDAVVAAITHEIGQPLSAVALSAKSGLGWLDREQPDVDRAIQSFHDTIDAGGRSFEVLKSIRATFTSSGTFSEFSLNDLARDTASLLDRELAAQRVTLALALDEALAPVVADRVQIQRVLVNLLTNAIESLAETRRRKRQITIRSTSADRNYAVLEVSDSGTGIAPEWAARIFEPFFTTKSKGTGLGLSLSRAIVEAHGGRIWATVNDKHGATFHLQLPSRLSPQR